MSLNKPSKFSVLTAIAWLVLCCLFLITDISIIQKGKIDTDLYALVPHEQQSVERSKARELSLSSSQRELLLMIGCPSSTVASKVDHLIGEWVNNHKQQWKLSLPSETENNGLSALASGQILDEDLIRIQNLSIDALISQALTNAMSLVGTSSLTTFASDPLGLSTRWAHQTSKLSPLKPEGSHYVREHKGIHWSLYRLELLADSAIDGATPIAEQMDALKELIQTEKNTTVLVTGIPLFSNIAATQAQSELSILGPVSTIAILILAWIWFARIQLIASIALVTASAFSGATALTYWLCGNLHLITLVFGTSLIGITVDYSAHYFCHRFDISTAQASDRHKSLASILGLALISSSVAFLSMGAAPLPGLRQMAVFCVTGLSIAYLTIFAWLPIINSKPLSAPKSFLIVESLIRKIASFGQLRQSKPFIFHGLILIIVVALFGLGKINFNSDIRSLNNFSASRLSDAHRISMLTNAPATSQFIIVKGKDIDAVLQKEEELHALLKKADIANIEILRASYWVPSNQRQGELLRARQSVYERLNAPLNELLGANLTKPENNYMTLDEFFETSFGEFFKKHWIFTNQSISSIIPIIGLTGENKEQVKNIVLSLESIEWVDIPNEIGQSLAHYRDMAISFLLIGLLGIAVVLWKRFGRKAWRAILPTLLSLMITLAILSWLGKAICLFTVFACILIVGLGIDYGIFITACGREKRTLASVAYAALTTLLSFGLLAFSSTPVLHTFGLTVAIGEAIVWMLTTLLRESN